jgi:TonB family protein
MEYNIVFEMMLDLTSKTVKIEKTVLTMDDDLQDLEKFKTIEKQIISFVTPVIYDFIQLKKLEKLRLIENPLSSFYNFTKENRDSVLINGNDEAIKSKQNIQSESDIMSSRNPEIDYSDPNTSVHTIELFTFAEEMPEFPGGKEALTKYLNENIEYPNMAKIAGIQGKVFIKFVVEKDGSISNVKVLRGIGGGCDEEAVRVIKNMPGWKPGKIEGEPVRVVFNIPVNFGLTD